MEGTMDRFQNPIPIVLEEGFPIRDGALQESFLTHRDSLEALFRMQGSVSKNPEAVDKKIHPLRLRRRCRHESSLESLANLGDLSAGENFDPKMQQIGVEKDQASDRSNERGRRMASHDESDEGQQYNGTMPIDVLVTAAFAATSRPLTIAHAAEYHQGHLRPRYLRWEYSNVEGFAIHNASLSMGSFMEPGSPGAQKLRRIRKLV